MFRMNILHGLKVLDLSRIFSGPYCTQILGDLGAEIIKLEPDSGDDTRQWGPPFIDTDLAAYFVVLNRNKRSICLDLTTDHGKQIFKKLVKWCDVLVENFRPGVTEKLGISANDVWKENPKVIYLSITAYGSKGPYKDHTGYDIISQAESGLMSITGNSSLEIVKVGVPIGDIAAGLYGTIGILSALRYVQQTGKGIRIETSLFESLLSWLTYQAANTYLNQKDPVPMGTAHPNIVPYQAFRCKDNKWLTISIGNQKHWELFCTAINKLDLITNNKFLTNDLRVKNRESLISILEEIFLSKTSYEWEQAFVALGLAVGQVQHISDVLEHVQVQALESLSFIEYPGIETKVPVFRMPLHFSHEIHIDSMVPPHLGEQSKEILHELGLQ